MKTKLFVWTTPAPWGDSDRAAYAMLEDGRAIASHLSSNDEWAKHDMGITSDWKHDTYQQYCPDGYELVWVDDPDKNPEWQAAFALNQERKAALEKQS